MRIEKLHPDSWLNVMPFFTKHIIDWAQWSDATLLLDRLLAGQLQQHIVANETQDKHLSAIYFAGKNHRRLAGIHSIAVGYPFILTSHQREMVVAPLCFWQLKLEPGPLAAHWVMTRSAQMPVLWNHFLLDQIQRSYGLLLPASLKEKAALGQLHIPQLYRWIDELCTLSGWHNGMDDHKLAPFPGVAQLGEQTQKGTVWPTALLGHFPPPLHLPARPRPDEAFAPESMAPVDYFPVRVALTPSQASAMQLSTCTSVSAIRCTHYEQRLEWIVAMVARYFTAGKRCMVVSDRASTLRRIQERLNDLGFGPTTVLLTDPWNDHHLLRDTARIVLQGANSDRYSPPSAQQLATATQTAHRLKHIQNSYGALRRPIFGSAHWTDAVGLFLKYQRQGGKELLNPLLDPKPFAFTQEEFELLFDSLQTGYKLFQPVGDLHHPLTQLHPRFFTELDRAAAQQLVVRLLLSFAKRLHELLWAYVCLMDEWIDQLQHYYQHKAFDLSKRLENLQQQLIELRQAFGQAYAKKSGLATLTAQGKERKAAQKELLAQYSSLIESWPEWPELKLDVPKRVKSIATLERVLPLFIDKLAQWRQGIPVLVHEQLKRLSSQHILSTDEAFGQRVRDLEQTLDELLEQLNASKLLAQPVTHQMLTIPQKRTFIEQLAERFDTLQHAMRDFADFHPWQRHYLLMPPQAQKVLAILIRLKPKDPTAVFASWYLHQVLSRRQHPDLPEDMHPLEAVSSHEERQAQKVWQQYALWRWQQQWHQALKALRAQNKTLYQHLTTKRPPPQVPSLEQQLTQGQHFWPTLFPIALLTPAVAITWRQAIPQQPVADLLLIDEANRMPAAQGAYMRSLAHQIVATGSPHYLTYQTSVLQWLEEHERPFYHIVPDQLKYFTPWYEPPQHWHVIHAEGRYDSQSHTNASEAIQVTRQLLKIKTGTQRTFPSVGVVCLTKAQRNLVYSHILQIKQQHQQGADKLEQLERNGLLVLTPDELHGQQFDLLLISVTYGQVNVQGGVTRHLGLLDEPEQVEALHLIARRQAQSIVWIHSIPSARIQHMSRSEEAPGQRLLAQLILLAQAIHLQHRNRAIEIAKEIGLPLPWQKYTSPFVTEVAQLMRDYLSPERIQLARRSDDLVLDLLIQPAHAIGKPLALVPDAFLAHTPMTAPEWERHQWQQLQKKQWSPLPLWSLRWWKDYKSEARKLASAIIKRDQQALKPTVSPTAIAQKEKEKEKEKEKKQE